MKRRDFMLGAAGGAVLGFAGCARQAAVTPRAIRPKMHNFAPENMTVWAKKPAGTMPMGELGSTGIKVSKYGFGSHVPEELMKYPREREHMLLEGYDLGIRIYDVYAPQYSTTGEYLKPIRKDIALSIYCDLPKTGTLEDDLARILRMFGSDHFDLVRTSARTTDSPNWKIWDELFRLKQKGMIRAVGLPIHYPEESTAVLKNQPIDFILLPYNFYHNILYTGKTPGDFNPVIDELRKRKLAVTVMKPFASEWFISHLIREAEQTEEGKDVRLGPAALRYIINSGLNPDVVLGGMWYLNDVYENVGAYFHPSMSGREKRLLEKVKARALLLEDACLPAHYAFLKHWRGGGAVDGSTPGAEIA